MYVCDSLVCDLVRKSQHRHSLRFLLSLCEIANEVKTLDKIQTRPSQPCLKILEKTCKSMQINLLSLLGTPLQDRMQSLTSSSTVVYRHWQSSLLRRKFLLFLFHRKLYSVAASHNFVNYDGGVHPFYASYIHQFACVRSRQDSNIKKV